MNRKKLLAGGLVAAVMMGMTGCSSTETTSSKGDDKQTLVIWSWGADEEKIAREKAMEVFQAAHPEIEITHSVIPTADHVWDQKMVAALSAGTGPDVIQMSPDYYGLYTEYYEDLRPFADEAELSSKITEGMLDPYYRPDGKLEGMPLLQNVFVLAYNKDMFDAFGVSYPTSEWDWNDLKNAAIKFAGGSGADATYGLVNHWVLPQIALICEGGSPYSDDLTQCELNSKETMAGLDLFKELTQSKAMPDDTAAKSLPKEQLFVSGKCAMYPMGGFETKLIAEEIGNNFEWDIVTMPKVKGNNTNNLIYATGYSMLETSQNKEAAWTFIKEVSYANDDMAKVTADIGIPANKAIAEGYYREIQNGPIDNSKYIEGLGTARLNIWGGAYASAGDVWNQIWQTVTLEGKSGEAAINEYYTVLEKAFNEANEVE